MVRASCFTAVFSLVLWAWAGAQESGLTVAVMPLGAAGLSEADAEFMSERLMIELSRTEGMKVMERNRRDEILREREFQQSGACEEVSCLVEAGRLLSVQRIIGGSIGRIGQVTSVQIRLINLETGSVERSVVRDYSGGAEVLLTRGMREVALELTGKLGTQPRDTVRIAPATPEAKLAPAAKKYARAKPSSRLKAPQLTYGSLALAAGFGMLALVCNRQADGYQVVSNSRLADAYRGKGRAALIAAAGSAAVCLVTSFLSRPAPGKEKP